MVSRSSMFTKVFALKVSWLSDVNRRSVKTHASHVTNSVEFLHCSGGLPAKSTVLAGSSLKLMRLPADGSSQSETIAVTASLKISDPPGEGAEVQQTSIDVPPARPRQPSNFQQLTHHNPPPFFALRTRVIRCDALLVACPSRKTTPWFGQD